jgi:hypothetical protein
MENNMDNITTIEERLEKARQRLVTDVSDLNEKQIELLKFSAEVDHGTPYFKIKHFVGDAQITPYQKYKQFLLEIRGREEVIENLLMNIAKQEAVIEVTFEEMNELTSPAKIKLKEFELITNKNDLLKIHRRLEQAYTERRNFIAALEEMYTTGEAYLPDGTDLKDAIVNEDLSLKLEEDHWIQRLGKQAALDLLSSGKIGTGNMDAISMMNQDQAIAALDVAVDWATRVNSAMEQIQSAKIKELANKQFSLNLIDTPKEIE